MSARSSIRTPLVYLTLGTLVVSCATDRKDSGFYGDDTASTSGGGTGDPTDSGGRETGQSAGSDAGSSGSDGDDPGDGGSTGDTIRLDVGGGSAGSGGDGGGGSCVVGDGLDAPMDCDEKSPPESFEPVIEWSWDPADSDPSYARFRGTLVTPLVGNLTDDNGDGSVDLCDTPDIVVVVQEDESLGKGALAILDGATGQLHALHTHVELNPITNPAIGDIDGDGLMEIVMIDSSRAMVAMEVDGTVLWRAPDHAGPVAIADLDADGDVEIMGAFTIVDHEGDLRFAGGYAPHSLAVDLDDDDDLEVILGSAAYHHDGTPYFQANIPGITGTGLVTAVADMDGDDRPEIIISAGSGVAILEHDGALKTPLGLPNGLGFSPNDAGRPATVADFSGSGPLVGQVLAIWGKRSVFAVFDSQLGASWSTDVRDHSGASTATAFDFLGDGTAETILTDEERLLVMDGATGVLRLEYGRQSKTFREYPTVADVDDDGSAEIVVPSSTNGFGDPKDVPTIQVLGERESRWVGSRRIWNQWAYHITNVREDGTIPRVQPKNWKSFNNFRVNAQVEGGITCIPPPPG